MVKLILIIICFSTTQISLSQPQLSDIDTVLDYKSRFFRNDTLIAPNEFVYWDSIHGWFSTDRPHQMRNFDVSKPSPHGLWIHYYDRKWKDSDSNNYAFYVLTQYSLGRWIKKSYTFNTKNELLFSEEPYPLFENEEFKGYLKLSYKNGAIYSAEYRRWLNDSLRLQYINETYYYPNGVVINHTLFDDISKSYRMMSFNEDGFCRVDYKNDGAHWCNIQRKRTKKHLKEIEIIKNANGERIEIYSKDGLEIKRRAPKNRRFSIFYDTRWWF